MTVYAVSPLAAVFDYVMVQGAPFEVSWEWKDSTGNTLLQSGDTAAMQIRDAKSPTGALILNCTSYFTVTTANISLRIPATVTAGLNFTTGYYDVEISRGGVVIRRVVQGKMTFDAGVTV